MIEAKNYKLAFYDQEMLITLGLSVDHNERLRNRNLDGYDLRKVDLEGVDFQNLSLKNANLQGANLRNANLRGSKFHGSILKGADLQNAKMTDCSGIMPSQIRQAKNYQLAFYSKNLQKVLNLPPDHNERLKNRNLDGYDFQKANLNGADFEYTSLKNANLQQTNLKNAKFRGANLQNANLTGVANLSIEQLANVNSLYGAKLDSYHMELIKNNYPGLLKK